MMTPERMAEIDERLRKFHASPGGPTLIARELRAEVDRLNAEESRWMKSYGEAYDAANQMAIENAELRKDPMPRLSSRLMAESKQLAAENAELRKDRTEAFQVIRTAMNTCFGGMSPGSPIWSNNQYDRGHVAGVLSALKAFDTAVAAMQATVPGTSGAPAKVEG